MINRLKRAKKMRRKINKKGIAVEDMMSLSGSFIVLVLVIIIFFLFAAFFGEGKIYATMQAENAAFTCGNNIIKFMNFNVPGRSDFTYENMLLEAHTSKNYFTFEDEASKIFDKFIINRWRMNIRNATGIVGAIGFDSLDQDSTESCTYRVAVPCLSYQDCTLIVQLDLDYKNMNLLYEGGGNS